MITLEYLNTKTYQKHRKQSCLENTEMKVLFLQKDSHWEASSLTIQVYLSTISISKSFSRLLFVPLQGLFPGWCQFQWPLSQTAPITAWPDIGGVDLRSNWLKVFQSDTGGYCCFLKWLNMQPWLPPHFWLVAVKCPFLWLDKCPGQKQKSG